MCLYASCILFNLYGPIEENIQRVPKMGKLGLGPGMSLKVNLLPTEIENNDNDCNDKKKNAASKCIFSFFWGGGGWVQGMKIYIKVQTDNAIK